MSKSFVLFLDDRRRRRRQLTSKEYLLNYCRLDFLAALTEL